MDWAFGVDQGVPRLDCMTAEVSDAYACRAAEYAKLLGSIEAVHPSDRQLVATWADSIEGPVIDAGCGPGQWTAFLAGHRPATSGVDLVPAFIEHARSTYPDISFDIGSLNDLDVGTRTLGGIFSWYSLIHHEPGTIGIPLREFARVLKPGGGLLIGFFEGPVIEEFAHAVIPAYRWPMNVLTDELASTGFDVIETHTRTSTDHRPHGAVIARRR